jgi:hypothetical protein
MTTAAVDQPERCRETVEIRDTYRYTGRVKGGFELMYTSRRCSRPATNGGYCWQHAPWHGLADPIWRKRYR